MERFREHEKQFKQKKFSKKSLLDHQRGSGRGSGSDDDNSNYGSENDSKSDGDDYGEGSGEDQEQLSEEETEEKLQALKAKDKEFFTQVMDFMKSHVGNIENELEALRNKKTKGPPKKQKEK